MSPKDYFCFLSVSFFVAKSGVGAALNPKDVNGWKAIVFRTLRFPNIR
jgi:hypothetical protein